MPIFRKKPVEIEAWYLQDPEESADAAIKFRDIAAWCEGVFVKDAVGYCILINTLEGQMRADPGDWIIKGVAGEFYPCKDAIFQQTYNLVSVTVSFKSGGGE